MTCESNRVVALMMRVQDAFLEAPALRMTLDEAEWRFAADRRTCAAVLGTLVQSGVLARSDGGDYVRLFPRLTHAA